MVLLVFLFVPPDHPVVGDRGKGELIQGAGNGDIEGGEEGSSRVLILERHHEHANELPNPNVSDATTEQKRQRRERVMESHIPNGFIKSLVPDDLVDGVGSWRDGGSGHSRQRG